VSARVLVIGSANVDYIVALRRLPRPGETVSEGTLSVAHGGKGANQAVAARRLGADVRFIGCLGDDASGRAVLEALDAEGIATDGVTLTRDRATGTALIAVDGEGRNQIAVAPGANRLLTVERVKARAEDFAWAQVVACQLETPLPTVAWALSAAREHGAITILNPAPVPDAPLDLLPLVDYLTPNAGEAVRLSGVGGEDREGAERAAVALRGRGAGTVIVTLGEDGALAVGREGVRHAAGRRVAVVDTTGAGDAFSGALAVAVGERRELAAALAFANAAAALACTARGAQPSLPRRGDVERLVGT
jgi:ribokinase